MATVFSVFSLHDKFLGCCSAKCYDAKGDRSSCVCGGVNHGVGLTQAARNTLTIRTVWPYGPHKPIPIEQVIFRPHRSIHRLAQQNTMAFMDHKNLESITAQI
jgi:hypothetical protein